jgi:hypothetical protein
LPERTAWVIETLKLGKRYMTSGVPKTMQPTGVSRLAQCELVRQWRPAALAHARRYV